MTYAHQNYKERVSTVTEKGTKLPSAEQRNVRLQHNFNNTDKAERKKYNQKFVCNNWGYTGPSARGCRHKKNTAPA